MIIPGSTWEVRNLPWIGPEEASPEHHALSPWLGLNYYPCGNTKSDLHGLKDWSNTSSWLAGSVDPASALTDSIRAKAAQLTAGASSELDKIRSIAAFTQKTNYVSVQMTVERGGGYTPHAPAEVLSRNYGDCKNQAALMRALPNAAGLRAFTTVIYSSDRRFVRPQWASTLQFNHAIVAIAVSAATQAPSVLDHPSLGHLLMFDPTDDATPVGNHALIAAPDEPCGNRI